MNRSFARVSCMALAVSLAASADEPGSSADAIPEEAVPIDEVVVIAPRSIREIRRDLAASEREVIRRFNVINDDRRYDILCRKRAPVGSQILRRDCKTRYYREAQSLVAVRDEPGAGLDEPWIDLHEHAKELKRLMQQHAATDAEFNRHSVTGVAHSSFARAPSSRQANLRHAFVTSA